MRYCLGRAHDWVGIFHSDHSRIFHSTQYRRLFSLNHEITNAHDSLYRSNHEIIDAHKNTQFHTRRAAIPKKINDDAYVHYAHDPRRQEQQPFLLHNEALLHNETRSPPFQQYNDRRLCSNNTYYTTRRRNNLNRDLDVLSHTCHDGLY